MIEARDAWLAGGMPTGYLLLKALPFSPQVKPFLEKYPRIYVVEQNRDAQMASLLRAEFPQLAGRIRSVLHYDGLPLDAASVHSGVLHQEGSTAKTLTTS